MDSAHHYFDPEQPKVEPMKPVNERRRHQRASLIGVVEYAGGEGVQCTSITDISQGGVRLVISKPERPGKKVKLRLSFSGSDEVVDVLGQIVWARQIDPYETGVRFLNLDEGRIQLLSRLLGDY
jgi:hypothetical protein